MAAAMLVFGCGAETTRAAAPQPFAYNGDLEAAGTNAERIAGMDALLESLVAEKKVSSVAGFVARNGQVVYHEAFGWKDIENRVPANVDDYYVLFSQTKAIVSVAFMTLVERGLVKLDDPVSSAGPETRGRRRNMRERAAARPYLAW